MDEIALFIGLGSVLLFLIYVGWRFGKESVTATNNETLSSVKIIPRILEAFFYCLAGLLSSVILFILSEIFAAASYGGVIKSIFIIMQILLGLLGGLGAIVFGIILVVMGISSAVKGVFK